MSENDEIYETLVDSSLGEFLNNDKYLNKYNKNDILIKQNETPLNIYFIRSGFIKLERIENGKKIIMAFAHTGLFLGLSLLNSKNKCPYTAQVINKTECISIPFTLLLPILQNNIKLSNLLNNRLVLFANQLMICVSIRICSNAEQKIRYYLNYMKSIHSNNIIPKLTHSAIASFLNLNTNTVYKCLKKYEDKGKIERIFEGYKIIDIAELQNI